jgi:hypothetical protein
VPFQIMLAFVLVGTAAAAAAVVGLLLPPRQFLYAGAALVLGAGVGIVLLGIGFFTIDPADDAASLNVILGASLGGFLAVAGSLAVLWSRRDRLAADL